MDRLCNEPDVRPRLDVAGSAEPLLEAKRHLAADLVLADELAQGRLDGQPVRPVARGMAVDGWPSIVPPTLTGRLVPRSSAEPGTVT